MRFIAYSALVGVCCTIATACSSSETARASATEPGPDAPAPNAPDGQTPSADSAAEPSPNNGQSSESPSTPASDEGTSANDPRAVEPSTGAPQPEQSPPTTEPSPGDTVPDEAPPDEASPDEAPVTSMPAPPSFVQSGRRLSARGIEADGGARQFRTFFDEQLGFECRFVRARTGSGFVCVPGLSVSVHYLDELCEEPVTLFPSQWEAGTWFSAGDRPGTLPEALDPVVAGIPFEDDPFADEPPRSSFEIGEEIPASSFGGGALRAYVKLGNECVETDSLDGYTGPAWRLIPHAEEELAGAEQIRYSLASGHSVLRLEAEDGAYLVQRVLSGDRACALQANGECVPVPVATPTALSANCNAPVFAAALNSSASVDPLYGVAIRYQAGVDLSESVQVYELQPFAQDLVGEAGYSCASLSVNEGDSLFWPLRNVTGTLPPVDVEVRGSEALQVLMLRANDSNDSVLYLGALPADVSQFFLADGTPCRGARAIDGSTRCAPRQLQPASSLSPRYADADCTVPLFDRKGASWQDGGLEAGEPLGVDWEYDAAGGGLVAIHTLVPFEGDEYAAVGGQCEFLTTYAANDPDAPLERALRIEASELPELRTVTY